MVWVIFLISNRPLEDAVSRHIVLYYKKICQLNQLENYHFLLDVISGVSGHRQLFGIFAWEHSSFENIYACRLQQNVRPEIFEYQFCARIVIFCMQIRYERLFSDEIVKWIQPFYASQVDWGLIWTRGNARYVSNNVCRRTLSLMSVFTHKNKVTIADFWPQINTKLKRYETPSCSKQDRAK